VRICRAAGLDPKDFIEEDDTNGELD